MGSLLPDLDPLSTCVTCFGLAAKQQVTSTSPGSPPSGYNELSPLYLYNFAAEKASAQAHNQ